MTKNISQYIELDRESRKNLYSLFPDLTPAAITNALKFKRNSPLCERVREAALQLGGKLMRSETVQVHLPVKRIKILDSKGNVRASRDY